MGALACLLFVAATAHAQQPAWMLDGAAFASSPAELKAEAAKITPEKFADVTVLFEEERDVLDGSGRMTNTHHMIYRIETPAGVEGWSEASVEWQSFYQTQPEIHARVIRADGAVAELDQKTLTDVPARNEENGTYSDERIHKAPLPALSVGAIVEEETVRTDSQPFFTGGGVYRNWFQRGVPVVRSRLIVEAPADAPLDYRTSLFPAAGIHAPATGGNSQAAGASPAPSVRRLVFEIGPLPAGIASDIDLATPAPHSPWVEFSTGKSWQSVAEIYRQMAEPQIRPEEVKAVLPTPSGSGRLALIQQLVSQLHAQVRYTGIEFGESALKPETPAEILKRHYGDCKDKATLLVAMLRASGIPANLALLDAGPGRDVTPDLPGMNQFDHAIVYVPAPTKAEKPLWIDATAEFTRVGDLPYPDQGRLALVIPDGAAQGEVGKTKGLTLIPEPRPEDSVLVETREFLLNDFGPAHVVESSSTTGHVDANYRANYGAAESKQLKASLENYSKQAYLAKALTRFDHSDPTDFSQPFVLRLDMAEARRGNTSITDAAVALFPAGVFSTLPRWFAIDPEAGSSKLTAEEKADREKAQAERSATYDIEPFINERRYRLVPPAGFSVRSLPAEKTTPMGPATMTASYSVDSAGVVSAVFRFNSGKPHYTTDEVLALRKAVIEANKQDAAMIFFDEAGAKLIAAGKTREALMADRAVVEAHADTAMPHIHLAYALMQAGVGEKAKEEALKATVLDPKSALAFNTLGWMRQFNAIGVHFGKGFDRDGAVAAYRKAKELDPDDINTRTNLAILLEHDSNGIRYTSVPGLLNAIQEYRDLKTQDKDAGEQYEDNVLFDLLYACQYKELLTELATLPSSPARDSLGIAATVASDSVAAGIARADHVAGDAQQRSTALRNAGSQLLHLSLYPQAAAMLTAASQNQSDAAAIAGQVAVLQTLTPFDLKKSTVSGAGLVVQRLMADMLTGKLNEQESADLLDRHAYGSEAEWQANMKHGFEQMEAITLSGEQTGVPPNVLADIALGTMKITATGDDSLGYRVTVQSVTSAAETYFVVKDAGTYKIVAGKTDFSEAGQEALYLLHHGNEAGARALLDWKRDQLHRGGGDDQLEGPLLPRFWTSGETQGAANVELAAASLLTASDSIGDLLPAIAARRAKTTAADNHPSQTDLDLLLAYGYDRTANAAGLKSSATALLKDYPDSITAMRLLGQGYKLTQDWTAWNAMLAGPLSKHPTDRPLLLERANAQQEQGDFAGAHKTLQAVIDAGQADSEDYNNLGWNALFEGKIDAAAIQAGQQSNTLSKNASFASLHTLACLYAAEGKTTEARQVLLQGMAAGNLAEPNSATWYAFGAIYEQYGVPDAAIAAYKKVEKPEGTMSAVDTYVLAQQHLKALHAGG